MIGETVGQIKESLTGAYGGAFEHAGKTPIKGGGTRTGIKIVG